MDLKINIDCGIDIDKDTAELALKIVNIYCNKNHLRVINKPIQNSQTEYLADKVELSFEKE